MYFRIMRVAARGFFCKMDTFLFGFDRCECKIVAIKDWKHVVFAEPIGQMVRSHLNDNTLMAFKTLRQACSVTQAACLDHCNSIGQ